MPAILRALRGDFFCLPFGGNATPYRGEKHPMHGETANAKWRLEAEEHGGGRHSLHLSLKTRVRPGRVDKEICLADGEDTVYSRHTISGMSGPMCLGHHAMLKFPEAEGSGAISTSRFVYGQVLPAVFEQPELGGYSSLKMGAEFQSLQAVPTATGGVADLSRYPARRGFEDLVMVVSDAEAAAGVDGGGVPARAVCVVRVEGSESAARDGVLDVQPRPPLCALEQPACECDGPGGCHRQFSSRPGGIGRAESNFRERLADLPDAGAGATAGCQLYHGRGGDSGRVRPGGGH